MKKTALLIFVALLTANAYAQPEYGIKAGVNISNFAGDDADGADPRIGFNAGGYMTYSLSDVISLQPEILFSSAGTKTEESGVDPDFGPYTIKGTFKMTYINVPVMMVFNLGEKFNIQAGPQVGVLINAKVKYEIESDLISGSDTEDVKEQFKPIDFGVNFGLGMNFGQVNACARYTLGLLDIPEESADLKNSVIQFSLGYKFAKN